MVRTPSATVSGMEIDGKARERRAREPRVPEALSRRPAERTRMSVMRRRGREVDVGAPRRESSWLEKISIAGLRSVMSGWIARPPHWGMSQDWPPPSTDMLPI